MQRGAFYIRVSTDDQTEYSPDGQLRALKEYASKNKITVFDEHIYTDEGISAKTTNRPAFQQMIAAAKNQPKPFDVIIVHKLDRFARNREDSVVYKALLRKECGVKVASVTEPIEDDKFGIIIEAMLEAMAEFYSRNLAEEVKKGQTEKALQGGFMTRPPYGYRVTEERQPPEIVPAEADVVRIIFSKLIHGWSPYKITKYLNESLQVMTSTGHRFSTNRVKYVLANPMYCGLMRWNMRDSANKYQVKDKSEWIVAKGEHEAIISQETFDQAQVIMRTQRKGARPQETTSHWLSGLVRCGNCGGSMSFNNAKWPFFYCDSYSKGKCRVSHSMSERKLTKAVLERIQMDANSLKLEVEVLRTGMEAVEKEILQRHIHQIPEKIARIKEAFAAGVDSLEEYKANKSRILREQGELQEKLSEINDKKPDMDEFRGVLKTAYEQLSSDETPLEEKKKIIRSFVERITFHKEPEKWLHVAYFSSDKSS